MYTHTHVKTLYIYIYICIRIHIIASRALRLRRRPLASAPMADRNNELQAPRPTTCVLILSRVGYRSFQQPTFQNIT